MNEPLEPEVVVFNTALQVSPAEREAYLARACGNDAALRGRVEALLRANEEAGEFLSMPVDVQAPPASVVSAERPGDAIGRYKLLQQIGEGGCGVVYMAEQEEPVRRRVALKVIKLGMDTKSVIARFEAERQALALMDHPNIARVLDAGATTTGRPYFVMELVRGVKITDYCDQNSLTMPQRLNLFVEVCRAVQHAHQKGIIHRDLKPSNILVTVNDGMAVPKVIDFGIAKATQGRLTDATLFTAFEQFIGTPAYMSPEQAVMTTLDVDTRSDIYSLGVLLYELLTGRPPFTEAELLRSGIEEMRRTIQEREPTPPSTHLSALGVADLTLVAQNRHAEPPGLIHALRGDLDWIVMKCLEKERSRRYETANGLAMDVQRFLADEPVIARPPGGFYRFRKLVRRNRAAFVAAGAVMLALLAGLGVSTWQFIEKSRAEREQSRLREEAQQSQANEARSRQRAELQELAARKKAYASDMNLLQQALSADDLGRAQELLNRQRPRPGESDLRGWEWRYFWQFCQSDAAFTLSQFSNSVVSVSFSKDGGLLGVATWKGEVTVWDVTGRRIVFRDVDPSGISGRLGFARSGDWLVRFGSAGATGAAVIWDGRSEAEVRRLPLNGMLRDLSFCTAGRLFTADWGSSNNIVLWDLASGEALARFTGTLPNYSNGNVFTASEDGRWFAHPLALASHTVRVVETASKTESLLPVTDELTTALTFDPAGKVLLTGAGYADGAIRIWDPATRQPIGSLEGHRSWVSCLKYLPDGRTLASASADRTVRLWDVQTRRALRTLRGHSGELWTVDVSPDGRWLASGGKDGSVIFWDLSVSSGRATAHRTLGLDRAASWVSFPDGARVGVVRRGRVQVHNARTLELLEEPDFGMTNIVRFAVSPDSRWLVASERTGKVGIWDNESKQMSKWFHPHSNAVATSVWFTSDSSRLVTRGANQEFKSWVAGNWEMAEQWRSAPRTVAWSISASAEKSAWIEDSGPIQVRDARVGLVSRLTSQERIVDLALSPDGETLAAASEHGTLELWDTVASTRKALLRGVLLGFHSVAISPDGERVIAGSNGQEAIKIWDLHSHEEVATLPGQGSFFSGAQFSPDGNTISARNWSGLVHFWTAPSWKVIEEADSRSESRVADIGR